MEVWVQSLVTHLVDLLYIVGKDVVNKLAEIRSRVDVLELFLIKSQHFVHTAFVLQLKLVFIIIHISFMN